MKQFSVIFETRKNGAIGIFEHSVALVHMYQSSFSESEVIYEAMKQLHKKGLETRFAVKVSEIMEQAAT